MNQYLKVKNYCMGKDSNEIKIRDTRSIEKVD